MPSDSPSDNANVLNGVSCPDATHCWAAGTQNNSTTVNGQDQTLVEVWSPSTGSWVKVTSDNMFDPSDKSTVNQLNGISCNSSTNCWAVGWFSNETPSDTNWHDDGVGLGLHWNGTSGNFDPVTIPSSPVKGVSYKLNGVSCIANGFCVAVGVKEGNPDEGLAPNASDPSDGGDQAFIALWNGATWEDVSPEEPDVNAEQRAELNGVSCVDTSNCMAVGKDEDHQTLAMVTTGGGESDTWFTLSSANKGGEANELRGVSCITALNCWAVGVFTDDHVDQSDTDPIDQALVEHWVGDGAKPNGTSGNWNLADGLSGLSSNNPSEVDNELNGVHCESATLCFAVGDFAATQLDDVSKGVDQTLIDQFNGTSWSLVVGGTGPPTNRTTDVDNELQDNELNGVDCLSASQCAAVGEFDGGPPPASNIEAPAVIAAPDESPAEFGTDTLALMWNSPSPGSTPGTTGTGTGTGTGSGTGSTPSTSVQAAKVPVPATGGGGALPLILLAGAGVASLASGITLIRSRKQ